MPNSPNNQRPGGIDTGTGGFPIGQNDSLNTYDVGSELGDASPKPRWSPGQINVDKEVKDLSRGTKRTLASYLSDTTLGNTPSSPSSVSNKYPINHVDGQDPDPLRLMDEKGYPTPPDRDLDGHLNKFIPGKQLQSRSSADTNLKVKRGRQDGNLPDGNELLKNVTPPTPAASSMGGKFTPSMNSVNLPDGNPVKQYYGSPNLSNSVIYNRFNPEGGDYQTLGAALSSQQFAKKYTPGTSEAVRDMSYGRLAQVGGILSSRASTELNSNSPGYVPDVLGSALPGPAQIGITKINRDELTAESVIKDLTESSISENTLVNVAGQSWGTLNNINDQFSGMSNFGMKLLAVALLVALSVVVLAMTALFSIGDSSSPFKKTDGLGRPIYGAYKVDSSPSGFFTSIPFSLWRMLGIENTNNPLNVCIPTGALAFFGMNVSEVTSAGMAARAALNGLQAVSESPGYYAILGRMIGLSFVQIGDAFASLGPAFSAGAFSGVSQIFNVVGAIRPTRFIRILNIFARVGDRTIDASKDEGGSRNDADLATPGFGTRFTGDVDKLLSTDRLKSRILNVGYGVSPLTLAWASYRAKDLFIVPQNLKLVMDSPQSKGMGMLQPYNKSIPVTRGGFERSSYETPDDEENRIDTKVREAIEENLDSEYVPFYIHDVRTNEIVSFHAFLASLSDGYTASYDTAEGIGRVEPIKIYKSTTRKVDFSFYVAATNEKDFDSMWLKINKLTTLLYPQFTEGRTIGDSQNNIYMPFSQTIQASPLVRVRIGDLITSNYSKFNLARIFGYTYNGTKFSGAERPKAEPETDAKLDQEKWTKKLNELRTRPDTTFTTDVKLDTPLSRRPTQNKRTPPVDQNLPPGLVLKVVKVHGETPTGKKIVCLVRPARGEDVVGLPEGAVDAAVKAYGDSQFPPQHILENGYYYILNDYDLIPTPSTNKKITEEVSGEYSLAVRDFMQDDPDNTSKGNAVARSFRSSGGKGLAGFIESMSFDWYDKVTWTTNEGPGRKAPKMCKVTISFSPIHDITPGLDHMGSNRAPIYRVRSIV